MNNRLQRYLQSKGQVLPQNLYLYKVGEERDYQCPFCDGHASSFQIIHFPNRGSSVNAVYTTANACYDCAEHIAVMEADLDGPPVRATLFESMENTAKARLLAYVEHDQFDSSVLLHYQWLDVSAFPNLRHCYFCKIQAFNNYRLIDTPVIGAHDQVTGGVVRACTNCQMYIEREYGIMFDSLPKLASSRTTVDRCSDCGELYHIDQDERLYRTSYKESTLGQHKCPTCTADQINERETWQTGDGLFSHRLLYTPQNPLQRFLRHKCEYCEEQFLLDVTLGDAYLKGQYMSTTKRVICDDCGQFGRDVIGILRTSTAKIILLSKIKADLYKVGIIPNNDGKPREMALSGAFSDIVAYLTAEYNGRLFR